VGIEAVSIGIWNWDLGTVEMGFSKKPAATIQHGFFFTGI
jgi:hypothetical protein